MTSTDTWKMYMDVAGEWRWQRKAPNGEIVGAAHEGYKNLLDCKRNALRNGLSDFMPLEIMDPYGTIAAAETAQIDDDEPI